MRDSTQFTPYMTAPLCCIAMHQHLNDLHEQIQTLSRHRDLAEKMCGAAIEILETLVAEAQHAGILTEALPTLHKLATSKDPVFVEVENVRIAKMRAKMAAELEHLELESKRRMSELPPQDLDHFGSNVPFFPAGFLEYTRNT